MILRELIRKEILGHLIAMRFAIACVLCLLTALAIVTVRMGEYRQVRADYFAAKSTDTSVRAWGHDPWMRGWLIKVHRPPNPLKILVKGIEVTNGRTAHMTAFRAPEFILGALQRSGSTIFPSIDWVALTGLILSLLAILFCYDAICGEKQQGTLRLLLSYSAPRHTVLLGKWAAGYLALLIPYLLSVLVILVILGASSDVDLISAQWLRILAMIGLSLIYLAAVVSITLFVSASTRRAETSIMTLSAVWLVLFLAIPNLSPLLAASVAPVPSDGELAAKRMETYERVWQSAVLDPSDKFAREFDYPPNWRDRNDRDEKWVGYIKKQTELRGEASRQCFAEYRKQQEEWSADRAEQEDLAAWFSRLSPFGCFAMASAELADAGTTGKDRYFDQLQKYQQSTFAGMYSRCYEIMADLSTQNYDDKMKRWEEDLNKPLQKFQYTPPPAPSYLKGIAMDAGLLACEAIIFFMLAFFRFLRYDVR
jgi:ABC-type transport system involved in multi-copper enzyme maturation permease subunit